MNNRPPISSSPSPVSLMRNRKKRGPNLIYIVAGVLIIGGLILLIVWLTGQNSPVASMFATETPTPTLTFTPTSTSTPTATLLPTETSTVTPTPTFSTIFNYTVQAGDSLFSIVQQFNLGDDGIALILLLNPFGGISDSGFPIGVDPVTLNILPGQAIVLPYPGMPLPTSTPIPANLPQGTKLDYIVQAGDSLAGIAAIFNSTVEAIIEENSLTDPNAIQVGQLLVIPVNIVTATPTRPPTSTPVTPGPGTELPTATYTPINAPPATSTPTPTNPTPP
ncbi:MAG: LysM peptidoglycan-binding domain-containing protein [Chloroflexi bacterium]|nr:LysM peptidoglycan-binding domain-containing protein [Chloroflexota bacterium]